MKIINQIYDFKARTDQEINDKKIMLEWLENYHENALTRQNEVAHFTSSAIILNPSLDKVCLVYHNIYQTYCWVGGHNDGDEDAIAVALKEAKEETGIETFKVLGEGLASLEIVPVYAHYKRGSMVSSHLHFNTSILLIAQESESLKIKADENSDVKWIDITEIENYSNEKELIAIYHKLIQRAQERKC